MTCYECGAICTGTVCETCRSSRLVTAYSGNPAVAGIDHASGPGRATYTISSEKWTVPVSIDDIMKAFGENPWRAIDAIGLNLEIESMRRVERECGSRLLKLAPASFAGITFPTAPVMINTREDKPMPNETGTIPLARNVAPDLEKRAHPKALERAREVAGWLRDWGILAELALTIGDSIDLRLTEHSTPSLLCNERSAGWWAPDIMGSPSSSMDDIDRDALRSALLDTGVLRECGGCGIAPECAICNGTGVVPVAVERSPAFVSGSCLTKSAVEWLFWDDWERSASIAASGTKWKPAGRSGDKLSLFSGPEWWSTRIPMDASRSEGIALIQRALGIPDSQAPVLSSADGRSSDSSGDRRVSGQSVPGSPSSAEDRERPEPSRVSAALINMRALFTDGDDISTEAHRWLDRIRRTMWNWDKRAGVLRINGDTILVHHDSTIDDVERMLTTSSPSAGEVHASGSCAELAEGGVICSYVPLDSEEEWGCGATLRPDQYVTGPCGTTCVYCVQRIRVEAVCERETVRETPEPEKRHPHTPEWPSGSEYRGQV